MFPMEVGGYCCRATCTIITFAARANCSDVVGRETTKHPESKTKIDTTSRTTPGLRWEASDPRSHITTSENSPWHITTPSLRRKASGPRPHITTSGHSRWHKLNGYHTYNMCCVTRGQTRSPVEKTRQNRKTTK